MTASIVAPRAIMRYLENMETVRVEIPAELAQAAGLDADNLSTEATRLLALELYREDRTSLERAAELSDASRAVNGVCRPAQCSDPFWLR